MLFIIFNKFVSNFVGFFPSEKPQIIGVVILDEPKYGYHWGGEGAATVFNRIAKRIINLDDSKIEEFLLKENGKYFKDLDYLHVTSNETINGIQIRDFKNINHPALIVDMSSDIGSYKFDWDNLTYIYAGAQKNMGIPGVTICIGDKANLPDIENPSYLNLMKFIKIFLALDSRQSI